MDEYRNAKIYTYKRLAARSYHSVELAALLRKKEFSEDIIENILSECRKLGYLNDGEWTETAVRREAERKKGPRAILQKLQSKGIPLEEIEHALEETDSPEKQKKRILKLLETRYRSRDLENYRDKEKVFAALARLGYDFDLIREVLHS